MEVDLRLTLDHNPMSAEELERDARDWMRGWARQFNISDFEAPLTEANKEGREIRVKVLRDMIDFCLEREYRPVYVIPPVTGHLAAKFSSRFREIYFDSFISGVGREVRLLNYLNDDRFQNPDFYFNSFFLNARGRRLFTEQVCSDLGLNQ